jgi:hypothetical protein
MAARVCNERPDCSRARAFLGYAIGPEVVLSFAAFLNHWWNLPFLVMLGLCGVFFLLQIVGLMGGDADHDVNVDQDADVDHDVDADAEGEGGMTAGWHGALSFLGVGRVPFMVVWVTLFLFSGFSGIFVNRVLFVRAAGAYRGWWFVLVTLASLVVGVAAVRLFSRLAARLVDVGGRGATAKHELAGKIGVVASPMLDARHGEIRVHDDRGNEILLHGCVRPGEASLPHGSKVVLVSYDEDKQLFWATACPEIEDQKRS